MKPEAGSANESTWLLLQRDLRLWVGGVEEPAYVTVVLDITDRGTRAVEPGATIGESLMAALRVAALEPRNGLTLRVPDRIQVPVEIAGAMRTVLGELVQEVRFRPGTVVEEIIPEEGAESVFDGLIAQMAGRHPAEERLLPEDSTFLYEQARRFMEAAPWKRWTSDDAFLVELKLGSQRMEGIATVMGHDQGQPGLLLMPGRDRALELMASGNPMPPGSLLTQLEGTEGPPDLFLRARRYGWPAEAAVTPNFLSVRSNGIQELDRRESWPMALVLAGIVAHYERGEVAETWGNVDLPSGHRGRYRVLKAPEPPQTAQPRGGLLGIKISTDLMPDDSEIQIGVLSSRLLNELRQEADVVVPPRMSFPAGIDSIPVITLTPSNGNFAKVVDRVKRAKPIGATVIERGEGPMLTIMGERAGFLILDDRASAEVWKRNIKNSDGAHVLMVTDAVVNKGAPDPDRPGKGTVGHVYGLFECLLRGGSSQAIER